MIDTQKCQFAEIASEYYSKLTGFIQSMESTTLNGDSVGFYIGVDRAAQLITQQTQSGHKLMFIGNGASQAISSHLSTDYWKNGGMRATAFTDPALLTCIGNDYGYPHIFEKPVEMFADEGDILIAISSSGKSVNILNACDAARRKNCYLITLSGFQEDNPLRSLGDINFYVSAQGYGPVEIIHHSILHCILDSIMTARGIRTF